ncbi:argininosuccinate lyase [Helicobacter sp. MIT 14-3879]|uniref:argininosuccinate lyase n=1 Tax=Helicobacter sp. MIT 14-3879 TaxID=2040649 RepID=UPI000E1E6AFF|nr:argininosuccinate lyase [Helicobacter sp. MIT 14-3879]RDU65452.1 argininosuccinate lyase [Helicobacter sp. MIT 14-3879]
MDKLWSGRFSTNSAKILEQFNASILFDKKLYKQDIIGSKIHAEMLSNIGVISFEEKNYIIGGLDKIYQEIEDNEFNFKIADEDIHMAIEKRLVQLIGDVGKKLHTARSRNDQVALDLKLYVKCSNEEIRVLLLDLINTLLSIAKEHINTIMPGMTHLQHAQPISLAFHLLAYCFMYKRDVERLVSDNDRNDYCPLGSAALAGSPYKIDRMFCANKLGFKSPTFNAMDSVSDRDFVIDLLYSISMIMLHTSRFAEELILWSSSEFNFITISDSFATGSSIMPNKKNPDVAELLRGKTGRVYGNLVALLTTMKAIPLAYNKDMQEDKEAIFDSIENVTICLKVLNSMLKEITINKDSMLKKAKMGHLVATDLADFLVQKKNISFRDAHHIVGKVVAYAESRGCDISELDESELIKQDSNLCGAKEILDLEKSMNSRDSFGGSSVNRLKEQIKIIQDFLNEQTK